MLHFKNTHTGDPPNLTTKTAWRYPGLFRERMAHGSWICQLKAECF